MLVKDIKIHVFDSKGMESFNERGKKPADRLRTLWNIIHGVRLSVAFHTVKSVQKESNRCGTWACLYVFILHKGVKPEEVIKYTSKDHVQLFRNWLQK